MLRRPFRDVDRVRRPLRTSSEGKRIRGAKRDIYKKRERDGESFLFFFEQASNGTTNTTQDGAAEMFPAEAKRRRRHYDRVEKKPTSQPCAGSRRRWRADARRLEHRAARRLSTQEQEQEQEETSTRDLDQQATTAAVDSSRRRTRLATLAATPVATIDQSNVDSDQCADNAPVVGQQAARLVQHVVQLRLFAKRLGKKEKGKTQIVNQKREKIWQKRRKNLKSLQLFDANFAKSSNAAVMRDLARRIVTSMSQQNQRSFEETDFRRGLEFATRIALVEEERKKKHKKTKNE